MCIGSGIIRLNEFNNLRKIPILFVLSILFCSCLSTKWYKNLEEVSTLEPDLVNLNGIYYNLPVNYDLEKGVNFNADPLYSLLFKPYKNYTWGEPRDYAGKIKIEVLSKKKIKASYIVNDEIVETKIISGKMKNKVFSVKRKVRCIFLLFFDYYYEVKPVIYLDEEDNLVVYNDIYSFANVLIASGGGEGGEGGRYSRADD